MNTASLIKKFSVFTLTLTMCTFVACGGGGDDPPPLSEGGPSQEQSDALAKLTAAAGAAKNDLLANQGNDKEHSDRIMSIIMEYFTATGLKEQRSGIRDPNAAMYLAYFLKDYISSVVPEFYARYPQFQTPGSADNAAIGNIFSRLGNIWQSVVPAINNPQAQSLASQYSGYLNNPFASSGSNPTGNTTASTSGSGNYVPGYEHIYVE